MSDTSVLDSLNSVEYLYLHQLSEPRDNSIRVIVKEVMDGRPAPHSLQDDLPEIADILRTTRAIETTADCKTFELYWNHYVAYLVTEEMVGSCGNYKGETFTGKLYRTYTKSHFLDHLARDTGAHAHPIQHYKITCLNHIIDIASYAPPEVRIIDQTMRLAKTPD
jgi:hypothetical protein